MSNITYANKEDLNVDSTIANKNKVMASDMNMIKTCVNDNQTQINTKESLSHKVTSLSSSSTDTEYPSAKSVYDALGNKLSVTYISGSTFTIDGNTQVGVYVVSSDTIRIEYVDTIEGDKYFILRKGEMINVTNSLLPGTTLYVSVLAGRLVYMYGVIHIDSTDTDYGKCSFERVNLDNINNINKYASYETTETEIGTWLGETLYRKVVNTGALPNTTTKLIAHNISNLKSIVKIYGYAYHPSVGVWYPLPYPAQGTSVVLLRATSTNITLEAPENRTGFTESYVVLEYTKTS